LVVSPSERTLPEIHYRYKSIATSLKPAKFELMPIIPITISLGTKHFNIEALVDSGANMCFCQQDLMSQLGIKSDKCQVQSVTGVGGSVQVFVHRLRIGLEFGKYGFDADVGFGPFDFHGFAFILGQKDFFENVSVLFERRKERLHLYFPK
jgi:hypothetical protein